MLHVYCLPLRKKATERKSKKKTFKLKWLVLEKVEKNCKIDRSTEKKIAENNNKVRMYKEKKPGIRVFVGSFGDGIINCRLRAVKKIGRKMRSVYSNSGSSCMRKHHTHHE